MPFRSRFVSLVESIHHRPAADQAAFGGRFCSSFALQKCFFKNKRPKKMGGVNPPIWS
jgi:hypothetical protein